MGSCDDLNDDEEGPIFLDGDAIVTEEDIFQLSLGQSVGCDERRRQKKKRASFDRVNSNLLDFDFPFQSAWLLVYRNYIGSLYPADLVGLH